MTETLLSIEGLARSFGGREVIKGVSFQIQKGQCAGLLGPNGAGKTTIFRMLAGALAPTRGTIRIAGHDLREEASKARRALGYMPETGAVYGEMTTLEYLRFRAELSGRCPGSRGRDAAARRAAELTHVADVLSSPLGVLSKGYLQRVMLAAAIVGDPPVLLLDEPTAGLDPNQVLEVRALVAELAQTRTIIISTHVLSEVEAVCSHALILSEGKLIASGTISELVRSSASSRVKILYLGAPPESLIGWLRENGRFVSDEPSDEGRALVFSESDEVRRQEVLRRLLAQGAEVIELSPVRAPLEAVFAQLTQASAEGDKP